MMEMMSGKTWNEYFIKFFFLPPFLSSFSSYLLFKTERERERGRGKKKKKRRNLNKVLGSKSVLLPIFFFWKEESKSVNVYSPTFSSFFFFPFLTFFSSFLSFPSTKEEREIERERKNWIDLKDDVFVKREFFEKWIISFLLSFSLLLPSLSESSEREKREREETERSFEHFFPLIKIVLHC